MATPSRVTVESKRSASRLRCVVGLLMLSACSESATPQVPSDAATDRVAAIDVALDVRIDGAAKTPLDRPTPDVSAPDVSAPDVSAPDAQMLDATPDGSSPDAPSIDASTFDAPASDVLAGDVSAPDVAILDAVAPDAGYRLTSLGTTDPRAHRRVLVVGADGLRADTIAASRTPNLTRLAALGLHTLTASTQLTGDTSSGPGWTSILTGVGPDKHRVVANANYDLRDRAWPTFLWRARNSLHLPTVASGHWPDVIQQIIETDGVDARFVSDDVGATDQMVTWITAGTYDVHFIHLDDCDHAGHATGFSPTNPDYRAALEGVDRNLGRMLDAIAARPALSSERWLVVFVTDHGGTGTSHGARIPECRTIPLYLASPDLFTPLAPGFISHMDVHPTVMAYLGARIDPLWNLDSRPLGVRFETACADRSDDDGDTLSDCDDPDCASSMACVCGRSNAGSRLGRRIFSGVTTGAGSLRGTCGGAGPETAVTWTAPAAGTYTFDTTGSDRDYDTVLYVRDGDCAGAELACNDNASGPQSAVQVTLRAGQRVTLVVDGGAAGGAFVLNAEALGACPDRDLGSAEGARVATGTVGDTGGSFFASCGRSGRDVLFHWRAPRAGTFRFDTVGSGYDTVLHARDGVCTGPELGCSDDAEGGYQSAFNLTLRAAQDVTLVLSGFNGRPETTGALPAGGTPDYVLNITAR